MQQPTRGRHSRQVLRAALRRKNFRLISLQYPGEPRRMRRRMAKTMTARAWRSRSATRVSALDEREVPLQ